MMSGIADPRNPDHRFSKEETLILEEGIDHMESLFPRIKDSVLYGGCEQSARLDMARAVARRGRTAVPEDSRELRSRSEGNAVSEPLSDYLYVAARYADYLVSAQEAQTS